ncbi:MAG: decaprenyl-phosphate phosphoribosyltransferase [Anaerolineae bacterium]
MTLNLLKAMRPKQWTKNVFLFAALVFDGRITDLEAFGKSLLAFFVFCALSSAVYLINDLADMESDRQHPKKRYRPLASGMLKPVVAQVTAVLLIVLSLFVTAAFLPNVLLIASIYLGLMVLYTFRLKHIVILDVMTVAAGFVLRVAAGAAAVVVSRFSPWLYVCTTLLALFIALNKRRHELVLLDEDASQHRAILQEYSLPFLDEMTSLVTATTLAAYSFYTFSAPNLPANHSMMLTIPFVLYGIFRYLYLIHVRNLGGAPEDIVLSDRPLLAGVLLWILTAGVVLYWPW